MSDIKLSKNVIYVDRPLRPEQGETAEAGYIQGTAPEMPPEEEHDHEHRKRKRFLKGEGDIELTVEAGDELGEVRVTLTCGGEATSYNGSVDMLEELLEDLALCLSNYLGVFELGWQAQMISQPSKLAAKKLDVLRIASLLEHGRAAERQTRCEEKVTAAVEMKVQREG